MTANRESGHACRVCGGKVQEFIDLGMQPTANGFVPPEEAGQVFLFRLAVGACESCTMVQLLDEVPQE